MNLLQPPTIPHPLTSRLHLHDRIIIRHSHSELKLKKNLPSLLSLSLSLLFHLLFNSSYHVLSSPDTAYDIVHFDISSITSSESPRFISIKLRKLTFALEDSIIPHVDMAQNTSVPLPTGDGYPFEIDFLDMRSAIFSYALLSIILVAFASMVVVDMIRKSRTGEFQESIKSIGYLTVILVKLPFLIFSLKNINIVWLWFTDFFRSEKNKKRGLKKPDIELGLITDSAAIIERLHFKSDSSSSTVAEKTNTIVTSAPKASANVEVKGKETSTSPTDVDKSKSTPKASDNINSSEKVASKDVDSSAKASVYKHAARDTSPYKEDSGNKEENSEASSSRDAGRPDTGPLSPSGLPVFSDMATSEFSDIKS